MSAPLSFDIGLYPEGDGAAYHVKNHPGETTRKHIVDRGDELAVKADIVQYIHGRLKPDEDPATLIVTDFRFLSLHNSRRFTRATITYQFAAANSADEGPDVLDIAPLGSYSLSPVVVHRESETSTSAGLQSGATPVSPSLNLAWVLKQSHDDTDYSTLSGDTRFVSRESGGKDGVRWVLKENPAVGKGVSTHLRTAILLKRKTTDANQKFLATVEIKVGVDFRSTLGKIITLGGKKTKDDPVIFDPPALQPPNVVSRADNLSRENLASLSSVTSTRLISQAEEGKPLG